MKPPALLVSFNKLLKWKFWANSAQLSNPSASKRGHKHQAVPKRAMLEGKGTILLVPAAWHHSWSNFNPYDIQHSVRISSQNPCCFWVEATELWGDGEMGVLSGFTPTIAMFLKSFGTCNTHPFPKPNKGSQVTEMNSIEVLGCLRCVCMWHGLSWTAEILEARFYLPCVAALENTRGHF